MLSSAIPNLRTPGSGLCSCEVGGHVCQGICLSSAPSGVPVVSGSGAFAAALLVDVAVSPMRFCQKIYRTSCCAASGQFQFWLPTFSCFWYVGDDLLAQCLALSTSTSSFSSVPNSHLWALAYSCLRDLTAI
eukprot:3565421-Heterocapsa_arctica.AAC.1